MEKIKRSKYCCTSLKAITLLLLFFSFSHSYSKSAKSLSYIKFKGKDIGVNEKIENHGYYKGYGKNSIHESFIFYNDGTLVLNNRIPGDTTNYGGGIWPPGSYYNTNINRWDFGADGIYEIKGDTIYAHLYFENGFYFSKHFYFYFILYMYKLKFVIVNRDTLLWCGMQEIDSPNTIQFNDTLKFIPASTELPPPDTRLKLKKRWLWENKKEWKKYKKEWKNRRKK
jgi:hypothetical protein